MGYPNKFIEKVVDEARDLLAQNYAFQEAVDTALDKHKFTRTNDRYTVATLVKRKLALRAKNKRKSNEKSRVIAEQNLSLPFPA